MWPLVSPPGVFKARNRAGRVRWHTSDMRDGHSSLGGGDKMHPHSHLHQGAKTEIQIRSGRQARTRDAVKKKKEKRRDCRVRSPAGGLRTEDSPRVFVCVSQLEDEPGRRRGEAARASLFSCAEGSEG